MADPAQSLTCEHNEQPRIDACPTIMFDIMLYRLTFSRVPAQQTRDVGSMLRRRWRQMANKKKRQRLVLDGRQKRDIESMLCYC